MIAIRNMVPLAGDRLKDITVEGIAGKAYVWVGFSGQAAPILTTYALAVGEPIGIAMMAFAACQGHLVNVTDDFGANWLNLMCLGVRHGVAQRVLAGGGALKGKAGILTTEWTLEPCATEYRKF